MANSALANPAQPGLMRFGMTTVWLNLHNAGLSDMNVTLLAMGIFYGGMARLLAGLRSFKQNNIFGRRPFTSCGMFWLHFMVILLLVYAGWIGLICRASACYLALGEVLNEPFGRTLLPTGANAMEA